MDYPRLTQAQLDILRDKRNTQPGFGALLHLRVLALTHQQAIVELPLESPDLINSSGTTVHGGAIFTVADTAAGVAAWSSGYYCATASANIHYLAPTLDSKVLTATATPLQQGKRLYVFDVRVENQDHKPIAQGTFSYMPLNRRILESV